jgi:hypothetical protein
MSLIGDWSANAINDKLVLFNRYIEKDTAFHCGTFSVGLVTCKTVEVDSHVAGNHKVIHNRYIKKVVAFHCFHYSSITEFKEVDWSSFEITENYWVPETFSVVLVTCKRVQVNYHVAGNDKVIHNRYTEKFFSFYCLHYSSFTYIKKEVMNQFWNNWEILSSRDSLLGGSLLVREFKSILM